MRHRQGRVDHERVHEAGGHAVDGEREVDRVAGDAALTVRTALHRLDVENDVGHRISP